VLLQDVSKNIRHSIAYRTLMFLSVTLWNLNYMFSVIFCGILIVCINFRAKLFKVKAGFRDQIYDPSDPLGLNVIIFKCFKS
jgi:hypothetical protein